MVKDLCGSNKMQLKQKPSKPGSASPVSPKMFLEFLFCNKDISIPLGNLILCDSWAPPLVRKLFSRQTNSFRTPVDGSRYRWTCVCCCSRSGPVAHWWHYLVVVTELQDCSFFFHIISPAWICFYLTLRHKGASEVSSLNSTAFDNVVSFLDSGILWMRPIFL